MASKFAEIFEFDDEPAVWPPEQSIFFFNPEQILSADIRNVLRYDQCFPGGGGGWERMEGFLL